MLTSVVVNNICQQMSYGTRQKLLVLKGDKGSLLQTEVASVIFVVIAATLIISGQILLNLESGNHLQPSATTLKRCQFK